MVIDVWNDYEYDLGYFWGVVCLDICSFWEFLDWICEYKEEFMEKWVVIYCIGGICCEKFFGWFVCEGFKDVG